MDKLISQLSLGGAAIQDTDEVEAQKLGEGQTKKFTGLQARAIEKAEREAQDDVIEEGCGLQADGTYLAEADSWYIRAADFATGCNDRGGATGALDENIQNALRLLDARIYTSGSGDYIVEYLGLSADTTLTNLVPAGYMLCYAIFEELSANTATLDLGTAAGGNQVFINQEMTASAVTTVVIERVFSLSSATTLYLNDDDAGSEWNGATVNCYFVMKPITAGGAVNVVIGSIVMGWYNTAFAATPPTKAEITALIDDPSAFPAGSIFMIYDAFSTGIYFAISDNVDWWAIGPYPAASFKTV